MTHVSRAPSSQHNQKLQEEYDNLRYIPNTHKKRARNTLLKYLKRGYLLALNKPKFVGNTRYKQAIQSALQGAKIGKFNPYEWEDIFSMGIPYKYYPMVGMLRIKRGETKNEKFELIVKYLGISITSLDCINIKITEYHIKRHIRYLFVAYSILREASEAVASEEV